MKSERRHELEHNELAIWLKDFYGKVGPYSNSILSGVLIGVLVLAALSFWRYRTDQQSTESWDAFFSASGMQAAELEDMAEAYAGTEAAEWALVLAGDRYRLTGCQQLFTDKAAATQELVKATEAYSKVLKQSRRQELRQRAVYGQAQTAEAQCDLEKATEYYNKLITNWPKGPFSSIAQARLDDLNHPMTKSFYDQFAQYDPKPAFVEEPGTPGEKPAFDEGTLTEPKAVTPEAATPEAVTEEKAETQEAAKPAK